MVLVTWSLRHDPACTVNTSPEMVDQCTLLLSNLRIETHHHHKIGGTSVPFPVACLLSQLRISTNELLNHLAGWRLLCICDLCLLIMCEPSQANSFHCDTTIFTFSARNDMCVQHSTPIVGGANIAVILILVFSVTRFFNLIDFSFFGLWEWSFQK